MTYFRSGAESFAESGEFFFSLFHPLNPPYTDLVQRVIVYSLCSFLFVPPPSVLLFYLLFHTFFLLLARCSSVGNCVNLFRYFCHLRTLSYFLSPPPIPHPFAKPSTMSWLVNLFTFSTRSLNYTFGGSVLRFFFLAGTLPFLPMPVKYWSIFMFVFVATLI